MPTKVIRQWKVGRRDHLVENACRCVAHKPVDWDLSIEFELWGAMRGDRGAFPKGVEPKCLPALHSVRPQANQGPIPLLSSGVATLEVMPHVETLATKLSKH